MTIQELFDDAIYTATRKLQKHFELGFSRNCNHDLTEFKLLMDGNYFGVFSISNAEDTGTFPNKMRDELGDMIYHLLINCLRNGQLVSKETAMKIGQTKLLEN